MIKKKKYGFILFGLFMGLNGMLVPPTGDFYRYTEDALFVKDLNWDDFLLYASLRFDYLLLYISYLLSALNINFDLSRFIYNSVAYILLGFLYLRLVKDNRAISNKDNWIFLAIFITYTFSTFLYRFFFSMILFLYGSYDIILYKKRKGWIFVMLSVLSHASFAIFAVGLIITRFKIFRLKKKAVLILCCMSLILDSSIMIYLMDFMPGNIIDRYMVYLDGEWAGAFLEDHSLKYRIMMMISSGIVYAGIAIYYFLYGHYERTKVGLSNYILLLVVLTTPFVVVNGRFLQVFFYNSKILFVKYYQNNKLFNKCKHVLLVLTIISTLSILWANRRQWALGDSNMILYSSFTAIITHTYTQEWINAHIFEDGNFAQ